jgi:carboxymethylenebutenolidase
VEIVGFGDIPRLMTCRLPGIPPTNLKVEIPFTAIVNIRGDRLFHEHISWDQASVLAQLGLLPQYLPYPYPVKTGDGKDLIKPEYRLPVAGIQTADKIRDKKSVESNEMFGFTMRGSS